MNKKEIENFRKEIDELEKISNNQRAKLTELEIVEWVSSCVSLFSSIELNNILISDFVQYYKPKDVRLKGLMGGSYDARQMGHWVKNSFSNYSSEYRSYLANVAFKTARKILDKKIEEERLVPRWLITEFLEKTNYQNIYSSLILIENNYEIKDSDGVLKNSKCLLDNILNLEESLKGKTVGKQLTFLIEEKGGALREKFGADVDFLRGLNNMRIVRNVKVEHKDLPIKYDIPFIVSVSCAYLVIVFLETVISKGELFK